METRPINAEQLTQEQKLEVLPVDQREHLENSWAELEKIIGPEKELPQGIEVSRIENADAESNKKNAKELNEFLSQFWNTPEETTSPKTIEIGIAEEIFQNYVARDNEGNIISYLQAQVVESEAPDGSSELSEMVWYILTSKGYKGKSVVRELFTCAGKDLLEKAKQELKPVKAFLGETEDEVELMMNRYKLKRVYAKDKKGEVFEVPYESPPEDESEEGVPEHFMIRLLDGRQNMPVEEFLRIVDGVYGQYTNPKYATIEYLKSIKGEDANVTQEDVNEEAKWYLGVVNAIRQKLADSLSSVDGDLFFMSETEGRKKGIREKKRRKIKE